MSDVTQLLLAIDDGDRKAAAELLPIVYDELRRLAGRKMAREPAGQTLNATGLVHEAYLRLTGGDVPKSYRGSGHFFAAAATAMRRILVDNARRKKTQKRGGAAGKREPLDEIAAPQDDEELLALDTALERLAGTEPEKARLVELRYFAGLTGDQAAEVLGVSPTTADRYWAYARAWLQTEVRGDGSER